MKKRKIIEYKKIKQIYEKDYNLIEIDGKSVSSKYDIFDIFSDKLKFPKYFGNNWDAFEECLQNLEGINNKKYVMLLRNLDYIKDKELVNNLKNILNNTISFWKNKKICFIVFEFKSNSKVEMNKLKSCLKKDELFQKYPNHLSKSLKKIKRR